MRSAIGSVGRQLARSLRTFWAIRHPVGAGRADDCRRREFYAQFVRDGSLCFDVGANLGNRTRVLSALGSRVLAIEPQPRLALLLALAFAFDRRVRVLRVALGAEAGEATLMVASADTLTTLSPSWVDAVVASGRFSDVTWRPGRSVKVATLDALIREWGVPDFIKIDVEGYEPDVLSGLSRRVPLVSFEFTSECREAAIGCVHRLSGLGLRYFNYSPGESMRLQLKHWLPTDEFCRHLLQVTEAERLAFGDVYASVVESPA